MLHIILIFIEIMGFNTIQFLLLMNSYWIFFASIRQVLFDQEEFWTYGHQRGKSGGMKWEIAVDIYTLICIK